MATEKLDNLIQDYISTANTVIKNQKPLAGVFGFGKSISNDACHEVFLDKLQKTLEEDTEMDAYEIVQFLLQAENNYECPKSVKFMLVAIQGLAVPYVSKLTLEQKKEFKDYFDHNIPKHMRLPVQDKLYKELCK